MEVGAGFLFALALALYLDDDGIVCWALLACLIHELGHLSALYLSGGRLYRLRLSAVGADMSIEGQLSYWGELVLVLAGPMANLVTALLGSHFENYAVFCGLNLALFVLNLLPVARLDGGRALYALCCLLWETELAQRVQRGLDWIFSILLLVVGGWILMMGGSFTLLFLALWAISGQKTWRIHKKTLA